MSRSTYQSLLAELRHNNLDNFKEILDTRGLPQDNNWYDYDLIMRALRFNQKGIVKLLLDNQCRVNKPLGVSRNTNTPLHLAAKKLGWCNIVEKMLRLNARVTDVDADGNTPLHVAFINHFSGKVIDVLLHHYLKTSTLVIHNREGLGFMHIACTRADFKPVEAFFDSRTVAIFNQVSLDSDSFYAGYSPLHFAVEAGRHRTANFLCHERANLYAQDHNGSTPIHAALEKRDILMIDVLFVYDRAFENYTNRFGVSHFMAACAGTKLTIVQQYTDVAKATAARSGQHMLEDRVNNDPNHPLAGYTPLHLACEYGRVDTVRRLLFEGNHFSLTIQGMTPLDLVRKEDNKRLCELLQKHCYICKYCNEIAINNAKPDVVVEITTPTEDNECIMRDTMDEKCLAAKHIMRGNALIGVSRDRIVLFTRTFVIANFPWFVKKLATKLVNFIMGPKKYCEFCDHFN